MEWWCTGVMGFGFPNTPALRYSNIPASFRRKEVATMAKAELEKSLQQFDGELRERRKLGFIL
jgi:hypothetical protein